VKHTPIAAETPVTSVHSHNAIVDIEQTEPRIALTNVAFVSTLSHIVETSFKQSQVIFSKTALQPARGPASSPLCAPLSHGWQSEVFGQTGICPIAPKADEAFSHLAMGALDRLPEPASGRMAYRLNRRLANRPCSHPPAGSFGQ
jgi:hypothetical protein